jgi:lipoprotein-anchoring transpeptidase ErfK/SrfK
MPHGGAPMPYCMFFNRNQALHGSPDHEVVDGNISHGCVRMHVPEAEWLRYNFVHVGTKVIVRPYD